MTTEQLSNFIEAAQCLSFTDVARRNFLTQPAISRQIRDLEKHLGVTLFLRAGHKLTLTDEGTLFLAEAKSILGALEDASVKVRRLHDGKTGRLSIGAVSSSRALFRCVQTFAQQYPDVQVDLNLTTGTEQVSGLRDGTFDFFFCDQSMREVDEVYVCVRAGEDRFQLVLPADHPLERTPKDFSCLADEPFVIIDRDKAPILHQMIWDVCARRGYTPKIASRFNRREAILTAVGAGLGITIFPGELSPVYNTAALKCFPIPGEDCLLPLIILWRRDNPNPAVSCFRKVILALYPE